MLSMVEFSGLEFDRPGAFSLACSALRRFVNTTTPSHVKDHNAPKDCCWMVEAVAGFLVCEIAQTVEKDIKMQAEKKCSTR